MGFVRRTGRFLLRIAKRSAAGGAEGWGKAMGIERPSPFTTYLNGLPLNGHYAAKRLRSIRFYRTRFSRLLGRFGSRTH